MGNRDDDILVKIGQLRDLPPVVGIEELLDTRVEMIDTGSNRDGRGRSRGDEYSLRDLLAKML